jgi:hypothetical protein
MESMHSVRLTEKLSPSTLSSVSGFAKNSDRETLCFWTGPSPGRAVPTGPVSAYKPQAALGAAADSREGLAFPLATPRAAAAASAYGPVAGGAARTMSLAAALLAAVWVGTAHGFAPQAGLIGDDAPAPPPQASLLQKNSFAGWTCPVFPSNASRHVFS